MSSSVSPSASLLRRLREREETELLTREAMFEYHDMVVVEIVAVVAVYVSSVDRIEDVFLEKVAAKASL